MENQYGLEEPQYVRRTVHIRYERGRMELYVDEFFPCKIRVARKIFPLINQYALPEDIKMLRGGLVSKIEQHKNAMSDLDTEINKQQGRGSYYRGMVAEYKRQKVMLDRCTRNLEMLRESED